MNAKFIFTILFLLILNAVESQNIGINTTGAAPATTNMLEILQTATAVNTIGLYTLHSGAITGTGYGLWSEKTGASTTNIAGYFSASGATNNYALIVPSTGGKVGIGTSTPSHQLHVISGATAGSAIYSDLTDATSGTSWTSANARAGVMGRAATGTSSYQAGVLGYQVGSGNNSGGVVGAYSATIWGGLGFSDGTGVRYGAYGTTSSTSGAGVYGLASDINVYGVYGNNTAADNIGVGSGVYGKSNQKFGAGVWGDGGTNTGGVFGTSANKHVFNSAVYGENNNNVSGTSWVSSEITCGIAGRATGTASYAAGVYGYNNNSTVDNNAGVFAQDFQGCMSGLAYTYTPGSIQRTMGVYGETSGGINDRAIEGIFNNSLPTGTGPWGYIGGVDRGLYASLNSDAYGFIGGKVGNAFVGVYGTAATAPTIGYVWSDDLESDLSWTYVGVGASRGAIPADCGTGPACITGSPYSGTNVMILQTCSNSTTLTASKTFTIAAGGGTLSFYYKLGSEAGWDKLYYNIGAGNVLINSGCQNAWSPVSVALTAGAKTITFSYITDNLTNANGGKALIDDIQITNVASSGTTYAGYFQGNGYLSVAAWTYGCDRRLKENITNLDMGLNEILKLKPVKFDYITGEKKQLGFIAQDVQEVIREIVVENPTGMLGLKTEGIIPIMVNAIKEQQAQIDFLKSENTQLKTAINEIKSALGVKNLESKKTEIDKMPFAEPKLQRKDNPSATPTENNNNTFIMKPELK